MSRKRINAMNSIFVHNTANQTLKIQNFHNGIISKSIQLTVVIVRSTKQKF